MPLDRDDGQHHIGVFRPAAILDLEIVVRFSEHAAQIVRRKQPRELGVFRFGQRDIAFRDVFDHFRILSGGRIERLTAPQLMIAVASGIQIDDRIPIDDATHALQETVALHLFALEVQPLHFLVLKAQSVLYAQCQHHDDDSEKTECAEQDERGILHVIQRAVHLFRLDDANERPVRKRGRNRDQIISRSLTDELRASALVKLDAVPDIVHAAIFPVNMVGQVVQVGHSLAQLGLRLKLQHDIAVRAHHIAVALSAVHTAVNQIIDHVRVIADRDTGVGHAVQRQIAAHRHRKRDLRHAVGCRIGGDDWLALAVHLLKNAVDAVGAALSPIYR